MVQATDRRRQNERVWEDNPMSKVLVDGIPAKRLSEICRAEQEGRLVIFPCKAGDVIYRIINQEIQKCVVQYFHTIFCNGDYEIETCYTWDNGLRGGATRHLWGESTFLTREAAEQALDKRKTAPGAATPESGTGK